MEAPSLPTEVPVSTPGWPGASDVFTLDVAAFLVFKDRGILKGTRGCLKVFLRNPCVMDPTRYPVRKSVISTLTLPR